MPKILALSGSLRRDSFNKKLVSVAAAGARAAGATVTELDIREFPLPLYDADVEAADGLPENAQRLKELFGAHDGMLIASPEYNGSIAGALKNLIDWVSRPASKAEKPLASFDGKVCAIMAASPGGLGGLRGLSHVREILSGIRVLVLPAQVAVPAAHEAFDADGTLKDERRRASVESLGAAVATMCAKLAE